MDYEPEGFLEKAGDLLGIPRGFIVNFVLKYVRKQIPEWA